MALVRRTAASVAGLERDGALRGQEQWLADLASNDTSIRRQAAQALSRMPDAVAGICAHLANERSLSVRSIILTGLIVHKSPAVVRGLLPLLGSEDANLRNGAIEALQQMPDEVAPHVEAMLADPDSDVRIFAVDVLSALPHPMVPEWLRRVVTLDPHVNVCAAALDALAEAGQPEVIPALEKLADRFSDVAFIQFAVDAAIRRIRGR
ncbi:MAG: HEAT repeat domain-containing protein [Acetobacteraceae bacterium]|jgi:HEAT repeat protein